MTATSTRPFDWHVILCHASPSEDGDTQWKISITKEMVVPLIKWFHTILAHPGLKCSRMTLQAHYYHLDIWQQVDKFHCDYFQHVKNPCKGMGWIPEHNLTNTLWYKVVVDLIGPWSAKTENFNSEFYTLTCIDTATNLVELARIDTKSSDAIAGKFEQTWLDQYPRLCVIHDNGGKFTGYAFTQLLCLLGIRDVPITSKNPQSNALYEQMHQTITGCPPSCWWWTSNHTHSMKSVISTTLKASPGALTFSQDCGMTNHFLQ